MVTSMTPLFFYNKIDEDDSLKGCRRTRPVFFFLRLALACKISFYPLAREAPWNLRAGGGVLR